MNRQVWLALMLCFAGVLAGCSRQDAATAAAAEAAEDEMTEGSSTFACGGPQRPEVQHYVGLAEDAANKQAAADGYKVRVVGRDGQCFDVFTDHQPDRVNFSIRNGTVTSVSLG